MQFKYKFIVHLLEGRCRLKEWERNLSQRNVYLEAEIHRRKRSHVATDSLAKENLVMRFKFNTCESFKRLFPKEKKISWLGSLLPSLPLIILRPLIKTNEVKQWERLNSINIFHERKNNFKNSHLKKSQALEALYSKNEKAFSYFCIYMSSHISSKCCSPLNIN